MLDQKILHMQKSRWNVVNASTTQRERERDLLVDDWLDLFEETMQSCTTPIIDLGCGKGNDVLYLIEHGKTNVIPCDYSGPAIDNIKKNFPEILRAECFDMAAGFPFPDEFTDVIIANLSLHYFTEKITHEIVSEIKRILKPQGILIFRVNSIRGVNNNWLEVEPHLFRDPDEGYKRFFDEDDI